MYLHLGQSVVVPQKTVLGVFDLDNASCSRHTRAFLERAQREARIINVSDELPRSFVVCQERGGPAKVYLSQLSSATLLKRSTEIP